MIGKITINNYKSVQDLELDLGRVTVLIGANGCGKSNILEATALCSAAAGNKLDHEFLVSRGIRVPDDPRFMRSAFDARSVTDNITVSITGQQGGETDDNDVAKEPGRFQCALQNKDNSPYSTWSNTAIEVINRSAKSIKSFQKELDSQENLKVSVATAREILREIDAINQRRLSPLGLRDFLIYSPENSSLRTFETEGQIQPLGIKGEGLFKLLTVLSAEQSTKQLAAIKEKLALLDWFEDFEIVSGLSMGEKNINIRDKYLDDTLSYFTQKSANEGFLFLLFYFTLFISRETPSFFAIDNIDASLNPKLCSRLLTELADLAKTYDKQAIVTTHNPAVLDGLNLNDDEQRLFVVFRNKLGHTKVKRIFKQEAAEGQAPVPLSEAFLRGYLGGLPRNF